MPFICFYEPPVQAPLKNTHSFSAGQLFLLQYPESFQNEPTVTECGLSAEYVHIYDTEISTQVGGALTITNLHGRRQQTQHNSLRLFVIEDGRRSDRCMSAYLLTEAPLQSPTMFSCGVGEIAFISQIPALASLTRSANSL